MYQIAYTNCIDRLKYCNRFINPAEDDLDILDTLTTNYIGPEEALLVMAENERLKRLTLLIDELKDEHKEVVHLIHFENLSYKEAADILKVPIGTIRSRLNRAISKLTMLLSEQM